jgi:hypothetical protein
MLRFGRRVEVGRKKEVCRRYWRGVREDRGGGSGGWNRGLCRRLGSLRRWLWRGHVPIPAH